MDFRDSWRFEPAAYELDKVLGLRLVPPAVERTIDGKTGSLQVWVEGTITEDERGRRAVEDPDADHWNRQMYNARLLQQLTYNTDFRNVRNLLVDPAFRIYLVDFSRAFRTLTYLMVEDDLDRFSRSALERLERLDAPGPRAQRGPLASGPADLGAAQEARPHHRPRAAAHRGEGRGGGPAAVGPPFVSGRRAGRARRRRRTAPRGRRGGRRARGSRR